MTDGETRINGIAAVTLYFNETPVPSKEKWEEELKKEWTAEWPNAKIVKFDSFKMRDDHVIVERTNYDIDGVVIAGCNTLRLEVADFREDCFFCDWALGTAYELSDAKKIFIEW